MDDTKLKKIIQIANIAKEGTVTPAELKAFLTYVLGFIKQQKADFASVSKESKEYLAACMSYIETCKAEMEECEQKLTGSVNAAIQPLTTRIDALDSRLQKSGTLFDDKFVQMQEYTQGLVDAVNAAESKPISKDDHESIVRDVIKALNKLRDPENIIDVINAINELSTDDDEYKIDFSHIKNAPALGGIRQVVGGNRFLDKLANVNTKGKQDGWVITWDAASQEWIAAPGSGGGGGDNFIDSELVGGSANTFTLARTPVTGSVHVYAIGQRLYPGDGYTISGAVITTVLSWDENAILADYRY